MIYDYAYYRVGRFYEYFGDKAPDAQASRIMALIFLCHTLTVYAAFCLLSEKPFDGIIGFGAAGVVGVVASMAVFTYKKYYESEKRWSKEEGSTRMRNGILVCLFLGCATALPFVLMHFIPTLS